MQFLFHFPNSNSLPAFGNKASEAPSHESYSFPGLLLPLRETVIETGSNATIQNF